MFGSPKVLTFTCMKKLLYGLNFFYLLVGFLLMTLPVYFKVHTLLTSWSINGGVISTGVFLSLLALAGIYGVSRQHQILLFFYMIILALLFALLFGFSIAALAITKDQQQNLMERGWINLSRQTQIDFERIGHCCGFKQSDQPEFQSCGMKLGCCKNLTKVECSCQSCAQFLDRNGEQFSNAMGGVSLFFSLTMVIGIVFTAKFRHKRNPIANPNEYL